MVATATWYVNSGATGANNGTAATDAWTSITSANSANISAGDLVYVHATHVQADGVTTWALPSSNARNPAIFLSVDFNSSFAYATGAQALNNTGANELSLSGYGNFYGFHFNTVDQINFGNNTILYFEETAFTWTNTGQNAAFGAGDERRITRFSRCSIDTSAGDLTDDFFSFPGGFWEFYDTTITLNTGRLIDGCSDAHMLFDGCDISATTIVEDFFPGTALHQEVIIRRSKLAANWEAITDRGNPGRLVIEHCEDGTITDLPITFNYLSDIWGFASGDAAVSASGGANDGNAAWSIKMTATNSVELYAPFAIDIGPLYVTGTDFSQTFTVNVAHNAIGAGTGNRLQDDEAWAELLGPHSSTATGLTAQGHYLTLRKDIQGVATDVGSTATFTWNGSGVGTPERWSFTYTPGVDGFVSVKVNLAIPGVLYVDPLIRVTT